jgi:hypothetical protein
MLGIFRTCDFKQRKNYKKVDHCSWWQIFLTEETGPVYGVELFTDFSDCRSYLFIYFICYIDMLCIYMPSTIRDMVALLWIKHNFYQEEQDQLIHGKEKSTVVFLMYTTDISIPFSHALFALCCFFLNCFMSYIWIIFVICLCPQDPFICLQPFVIWLPSYELSITFIKKSRIS